MRHVATGGFFVLLMLLPVSDEIIGGIQFRALCKAGAIMRVDEERAKNSILTARRILNNGYMSIPAKTVARWPLEIRESSYEFYSKNLSEPVIDYKTYSVKGGILIRFLGISEGNHPLVIPQAHCKPPETIESVVKRLNITIANWK